MNIAMKILIPALLLVALSVTAAALTPQEAGELDLSQPTGLTAEQLRPALRELAPYAQDFIEAERRFGVNAVFLASLAAFESGWGRFCIAENNIFGWSGPAFESKSECILEIARRIEKNYLSEDGRYHRGNTLSGVNLCYNGSGAWLEGMSRMMAQIGTASGYTAPEGEPETRQLPFASEAPMVAQLTLVRVSTAAM